VLKWPMVAWKGAGAQMANGGLEGIFLVGHISPRLVMSDGENKCLEHWKCLILVELFAELKGNIGSCYWSGGLSELQGGVGGRIGKQNVSEIVPFG
jgi:hypothetical protein